MESSGLHPQFGDTGSTCVWGGGLANSDSKFLYCNVESDVKSFELDIICMQPSVHISASEGGRGLKYPPLVAVGTICNYVYNWVQFRLSSKVRLGYDFLVEHG